MSCVKKAVPDKTTCVQIGTGFFTTRPAPPVIDAALCPQPLLTVSFPTKGAPGSVVLANGAVVDPVELGSIVSTFCPAIVCPETVVLPLAGLTGLPGAAAAFPTAGVGVTGLPGMTAVPGVGIA